MLKSLVEKVGSVHEGMRTFSRHVESMKEKNMVTEIKSAFNGSSVGSTQVRRNKNYSRGFPGGTVVENLSADAGDTGLSPGLGRSHMPRSN